MQENIEGIPIVNAHKYNLSGQHWIQTRRVPVYSVKLFDTQSKFFWVEGQCRETVKVFLVPTQV